MSLKCSLDRNTYKSSRLALWICEQTLGNYLRKILPISSDRNADPYCEWIFAHLDFQRHTDSINEENSSNHQYQRTLRHSPFLKTSLVLLKNVSSSDKKNNPICLYFKSLKKRWHFTYCVTQCQLEDRWGFLNNSLDSNVSVNCLLETSPRALYSPVLSRMRTWIANDFFRWSDPNTGFCIHLRRLHKLIALRDIAISIFMTKYTKHCYYLNEMYQYLYSFNTILSPIAFLY